MRQTISGLVAALAVVAASAVPAMACGGGGLFSSCSPCGRAPMSARARSASGRGSGSAARVYSGCNSCGWAHERLPDPVQQYEVAPARVHQYYYADQGPTYTGPGNFAPYPTVYQGKGGVSQRPCYGYPYHRHHYHAWHAHMGYHYMIMLPGTATRRITACAMATTACTTVLTDSSRARSAPLLLSAVFS